MTEKLEKLGTALSDALKEVQQIDVLLAGKRQTIAALDRQETEMSAALREKADEIAKLNVKIVLLRQRADGLVREAQTQANNSQ